MRNEPVRTVAVGLAAALLTIGAFGCDGTETDDSDSEASAKAAEDEASDEAEESGDNGEEGSSPPADLYDGIQFRELSGEDRGAFVAAAKEELCPCEDSNVSLHKCLQSEESRCTLARRAGMVMVQGFAAGAARSDVMSRVTEFLEQSRKAYDFALETAPHRGSADAPVRIVEFADFECPHCKRASSMLEKVVEKYEGQVVHYFKHFPLPAHEQAKLAAKAAVAAQMQNKFWPMHDLLFENQQSLSQDKILQIARQIGLNFSKFKRDLQSEKVAKRVGSDQSEGRNANVSGTPAIFINGRQHVGPLKQNALAQTIRAELDGDGDGSADGDGGDGASDEEGSGENAGPSGASEDGDSN